MLSRDLRMILSRLSTGFPRNLDSMRGGLRDLFRLFKLHGILRTQRCGGRLLLGLWSAARFGLAFVLEVLKQLTFGEHRVVCAYSLMFEANVWMINWASGMVLVDYHRNLSRLMEDLREPDYWWVVIPGRFILLRPLLRSLFRVSDRRLTSLPHVLLDIFVKVVEILLNFMMFINFYRELETSLDLFLSLLALNELVDLR